jgi:cell filamentation protein
MSNASDPYLYPGTNVLRNIPDLRDGSQLATFESHKTAARIYKHLRSPIKGEFDTAHLKAIHRHVFQDVFAWAGQFRTTVLGKAEFVGHSTRWFTPPHLLGYEADRIFARLHQANLLRSLSRPEFVSGAVQLFAEINKLHPFREGNGRTQRLFIDAVARQAGHEVTFDVVSRERMVSASIEAIDGNLGTLTRIFEEITDETRIQPLRRAIAFLSAHQFKWNETYLATTTAGETYSGRLVGRDRDAFMMRTDDNRILVGRATDIDSAIPSGERLSFRAT